MRRARFLRDEQRGKQCRHGKPGDHQRIVPTGCAAFDDGAGKRAERCDRGDLAGQVDLSFPRARGLAGKTPGQPQAGKPDRQIDQKDRAPAYQRDQAAADQRTGRQRDARAGRPDGDRASARLVVDIGVAEQRERIRHENGRRHALHAARRNQQRRIWRERAGERCCGEQRESGHENPLGADTIAERARGEDESRKGDGIGVHDPLQLCDATAKRTADGMERGVDDGDIELHHAVAKTHRSQCQRRRQFGFRSDRGTGAFILREPKSCTSHGSPRIGSGNQCADMVPVSP